MSWKKVKLGELLTESRIPCDNPNPDRRIKVKLKVLGVEKRGLENEIEGATKQFIRKAGQFIYGKQNFHKGAFGIIPDELDGFESSADLPAFDVSDKCLPEWIFYYFKQGNYYLELSKIARGVATQRIHPEQIYDLEIPLPDLNTQKNVLHKINSLEENGTTISTELTYQITLVKKLRQQLLQDAVQGKLVEQNPKDEPASELLKKIKKQKHTLIKQKKLKIGRATEQSVSLISDLEIPKTWQWCKSDEIFFVTKLAGFEYSEHISLKESGEIPVVRAQNVRPLNIDKTNLLYIDAKTSSYLERCALTKKCLLVTFIGAGIGDVATFEETERWHLAPNVAKMEPFEGCEEFINVKYLNYYLMSKLGQREIFKHVKATAQPSLSMGTIRDIDFAIPPLAEQNRIVQKLDELMQYCNELEASIKQSESQNEKLLQQVLREALRKEPVEV